MAMPKTRKFSYNNLNAVTSRPNRYYTGLPWTIMEQRDLWDGFYRDNGRAWRGNSRIPDPLGGRGDALDLGCGNGKTVSTLLDLGYGVTGADFSETAVEMCRENFGDRAAFVTCDVSDLPFPDCSFDYVTAVHVLEHVDDAGMSTLASEIRRVLRPGGYVFVRSFTPSDMRSGARSGEGIRYVHRNPDGIVRFFRDFTAEYARRVDEPTRFGTVRSRAECLFRKPAE